MAVQLAAEPFGLIVTTPEAQSPSILTNPFVTMPMSVETLLRGGRSASLEDANPGRVMAFLRAKRADAFLAKEMADALEIQIHTLSAVLQRLRSRGLVDKQGTYCFIPTDSEGANLAMIHATTGDLNKRLGVEDPDDRFSMAIYRAGDAVWGPDACHDDCPTLTLGSCRPCLVIRGDA